MTSPAIPPAAAVRARIEHWVRPEIRALHAYHVPPAAGLIKLDAMENPYRWPPAVVESWLETLREVGLNRYPDPGADALKHELRAFFGVPRGMELLLGNGSDELLQIVALAVAAPGRVALAPQPAFSMYRMISIFTGLDFVGVPLRASDFALEREAMLAEIARRRPALVLLDYPNNPTGGLFEPETVRAVIEAAPGLVVVDEAYQIFSGATLMDWLHDHPNLLVLRTLSKLGLAGLRLGMLAGRPEWIAELDKIRLPYNINVLTQASAEFALRHRAMLEEQAGCIRADREALVADLRACRGLTVYPSRANFILFRAPAGRGGAIFAGLRERGVLIKNLDGAGEALRDCLRVTVGTPAENRAFLTALAAVL
ncbi:MAG: histidinol-phosphate transaminase [Gammaproteobacteria bacterium]|nr:histidinol-phosphate transaminase [Gammaproteobacteria bacterium]